ncbi:MAG: outer membrane beta-barrel protein [Cyclobacteriaceae bacterium]
MRIVLNSVFILCIVGLSSSAGLAQLRIPSMDVSLKGGYSLLTSTTTDVEGVIFSGSLLVHINEIIAVGPYFSRDLEVNSIEFTNTGDEIKNTAHVSVLGLTARLSTNRNGRVRPYLNLIFYQMELVNDYETYRLAQKTAGFAGGVGLMIKLNRNLYLNAVEATVYQLGDDIFFLEGAKQVLQLQTGLSYNFGRKK